MHSITQVEHLDRKTSAVDLGSIRWLKSLHKHISPDMQKYFEWPVSIEDAVEREVAARAGGSDLEL
jgi:hypothetical protein